MTHPRREEDDHDILGGSPHVPGRGGEAIRSDAGYTAGSGVDENRTLGPATYTDLGAIRDVLAFHDGELSFQSAGRDVRVWATGWCRDLSLPEVRRLAIFLQQHLDSSP